MKRALSLRRKGVTLSSIDTVWERSPCRSQVRAERVGPPDAWPGHSAFTIYLKSVAPGLEYLYLRVPSEEDCPQLIYLSCEHLVLG